MRFNYHPKPKRSSWYPSGMLAPALSFFPPDHDFEGMSEKQIEAYKERMKKQYWRARKLWLELPRTQQRQLPWDRFLQEVWNWRIIISDYPELSWHWLGR
jgi:hypothetical protein